MDSTTHTTTTVEFVDWRAKAKAKLEAEDKLFKGGRAAKSVQSYVLRTLLGFVDQEPRSSATRSARSPNVAPLLSTTQAKFCPTSKPTAVPCSFTFRMPRFRSA